MDFFIRTDDGKEVPVIVKDTGTQNPNAGYAFGPGGLFNTPGLNRGVVNATILPILGLQSMLPILSSQYVAPIVPILTGLTASTGSNPESPCAPGKTVGLLKLCNISTPFGRVTMNTPTIDLTRIGQLTNRGYFTDFQLMGNPLNPTLNNSTPKLPVSTMAEAITSEVAKQNLQFSMGWTREFSKLLYAGNPVNNLGDGYKEFRGLDILINTGYQDAETGVWCPAANSLLQDFGQQNISTTGSAGTNFVQVISDMYRALNSIADRAGLQPVEWVLSMPRDLFYEATKVWAISYATTAITVVAAGQTNTQLQVPGMDMQRLRDDLRQNSYLLINGVRVPVAQDDACTVTNPSPGVYQSTVYFVPKFVLGNTPATYLEHFNFDGPSAFLEAAQVFGIRDKYFTTNNGRYAFVKLNDSYCVSYQAVEIPRLRLDFPHLAARLTQVRWSPPITSRSPYPGDATFYNGGHYVTASAPSFYPPNVYDGSDERAAVQ